SRSNGVRTPGGQKALSQTKAAMRTGAEKRTRTSTVLRPPGPEPGASTNSAISANGPPFYGKTRPCCKTMNPRTVARECATLPENLNLVRNDYHQHQAFGPQGRQSRAERQSAAF